VAGSGTPGEQQALLEADRRFDRETAEQGVDGWVSWFAPNGSMVNGDQPPLVGHETIRAAMTPALAGAELRWHPDRAEVVVPGAIVVTTGTYVSRRKTAGGEEQRSTGRYVSVWKKQEDGTWKVLLDTGVPDPAP
jgi:ketosteroid isomerase-like protein